ncbi:MAG: hypothetical protein K6E79_05315 [Pseudobutyrivibrio sp.]|nr:hypothetical protein [Pseudobutyrivibrio sp.]
MGFFNRENKIENAADTAASNISNTVMRLYLVDYENVSDAGLVGIDTLTAYDHVIIFYGSKVKSIAYDSLIAITNSKATIEHLKAEKTAKNYLDFQLTTYLGYKIAQIHFDQICVVSKDSGFDAVVDFWTGKGYTIYRQPAIVYTESAAEDEKAKEAKTTTKRKTSSRTSKTTSRKPAAKKISKNTQGKKDSVNKDVLSNNSKDIVSTEKIEKTTSPEVIVTEPNITKNSAASKPNETSSTSSEAPFFDPDYHLSSRPKIITKSQPKKSASKKTDSTSTKANKTNIATNKKNSSASTKSSPKKKQTTTKPHKNDHARSDLRSALKNCGLSAPEYKKVYDAFEKSTSEVQYNNALQKKFGNDRTSTIYKATSAIFVKHLK